MGVLVRERELRKLAQQRSALQTRLNAKAQQLAAFRARKREIESGRDEVQRALHAAYQPQSELSGQLQSHRGKLETAHVRSSKLVSEWSGLLEQMDELHVQKRASQERQDSALARISALEEQHRVLEDVWQSLRTAREQTSTQAKAFAGQAHALALSLESKRSALVSLEQSLARMERQRRHIEARRRELAAQLDSDIEPVADLESERQTWLERRLQVDEQLRDARRSLEDADANCVDNLSSSASLQSKVCLHCVNIRHNSVWAFRHWQYGCSSYLKRSVRAVLNWNLYW